MPQLKLGDVWVHFPYIPYKPQETFMAHVISCLQNKYNALLESPTGTGKTLCLLCSSLSWLDSITKMEEDALLNDSKKVKDSNPLHIHKEHRVFFCSRTHSQLQQAVQEFNSTEYKHLRASILCSRKHLCIHPQVKQNEKNMDSKCRALRRTTNCEASPPVDIEDVPVKCTSCQKDHPCPFYLNFRKIVDDHKDQIFTEVCAMDQKHLIAKCKEYKVCPFYMARHLAHRADVVFLPYSYIFNPHILHSLKLKMKGSVLIVDEGHNIERVCEENASIDIHDDSLSECILELTKVKDCSEDEVFPRDVTSKDITALVNIVDKIQGAINNYYAEGKFYSGDTMLENFRTAGFSSSNKLRLLYILKQVIQFCGEKDLKADGMRSFISIVRTIFYQDEDNHDNSPEERLLEMKLAFTVYVDPQKEENRKPRVTHFWCFDASVLMKSLSRREPRSIIITSGTLAPLNPLARSLGIPFQVREVNSHVIDSDQAFGITVVQGHENIQFDSTVKYRAKVGEKYYSAVGRLISDVARATPDGLLIFFQSKTVRKECLEAWSQTENTNDAERKTLFETINSAKEIFVEPEISTDLPDLQSKYNKKVDEENSSGACLIGIMGGKVSEGLDFKNQYGRAVIMVGLPFPPVEDPRVKRKKDILKLRFKSELVGREWYRTEATRSVNQAIGRVIRHRTDFGAIILLDRRFHETVDNYEVYQDLPKWLRRNMHRYADAAVGSALEDFFSRIKVRIPEIMSRVAQEQEETSERYRKDIEGEEMPAAQFHQIRAQIDDEKGQERHLKEISMTLSNTLHSLHERINQLKQGLAKHEKISSLLMLENDESTNINDSGSDWESGSDCEWDIFMSQRQSI